MSFFERCDFQPEWNQLCPEWYEDPNTPPPERRWQFFARKHEAPCGETVEVRAWFFDNNCVVDGEPAQVEIRSDYHPVRTYSVTTSAQGVVIPVTLDRPGFVRIGITCRETTGPYGIGFSIRSIQPYPEVPGFDAFWEKQLSRLASVPADILESTPLEFSDYPSVASTYLRIRSTGDIPVSAIISKPKGAAPKSLPGYAFFHGAGVRPPFPPLPWAKLGFLAMNVSALGLEYGKGADYEQAMARKFQNYSSKRASNPADLYFTDMALRVKRSLDYFKTLPEWNGKILVVHGGSQGGWQSLVAAALDKDVTFAQVEAPANCNVGAALEGRTPSWPGTVLPQEGNSPENIAAQFVDGLAFARRATAPAVFTAGYSDSAAVPSSVLATYNAYAGPKDFWAFPDLEHEKAIFWSGEKAILEAAGL